MWYVSYSDGEGLHDIYVMLCPHCFMKSTVVPLEAIRCHKNKVSKCLHCNGFLYLLRSQVAVALGVCLSPYWILLLTGDPPILPHRRVGTRTIPIRHTLRWFYPFRTCPWCIWLSIWLGRPMTFISDLCLWWSCARLNQTLSRWSVDTRYRYSFVL